MKNSKNIPIFIFSFLFGLFLFESANAKLDVVPKSCSSDLSDPYAPNVTMTRGIYKNQCMDTSAKRAVQVLNLDSQTLEIANFRYMGKFYKAIIPRQGFEGLSYTVIDLNGKVLTEYLGVQVTHVEFKIKMKPESPVILYSQKTDSVQAVQKISEFVISYNYMAPPGVEYSPKKGLDENLYASVIQMFAFEDEVQIRKAKKQNIYEIKLTLDPQLIERLVTSAAIKSGRVGYHLAYDTWTNNCATQLFDIMDEAFQIQGRVKRFRFKWYRLQDTSLKPAIKALKSRGLIRTGESLRSLNSSYGLPLFESPGSPYFKSWLGKGL